MDQHRQHWRVPDESYQEDLPNVDDLEVAAAAAGELMRPAASSDQVSSSESSEEESSSSGEESTSDDDDDDESQASGSSGDQAGAEYVAVRLLPDGEGFRLLLDYLLEDDMSSQGSSEMSIDDFVDIREMLEAADIDDEDGPGDGSVSAANQAATALLGKETLATDVPVIDAEEAITQAGTIQGVLEGLIVVKASASAPALHLGTWLVLADRSPLGVVEDVFGPVLSPLYALRAGGEGCGTGAGPGDPVFSVDRLAEVVHTEELRAARYDAAEEEVGEDGPDPDATFSDDEAEAAYLRQLNSKRKGSEAGRGAGRQQRPPRGGGSGRGRGPGTSRREQQPGREQQTRGRGGRGQGRGHPRPGFSSPLGPPPQQQAMQAMPWGGTGPMHGFPQQHAQHAQHAQQVMGMFPPGTPSYFPMHGPAGFVPPPMGAGFPRPGPGYPFAPPLNKPPPPPGAPPPRTG
ncbi:hypothetical protein ACKKBF_B04235 [Auxenochlorella protothecoides x Auxenochlorella symbiontica]